MVKGSDWLKIKLRVPDNYRLICELCFRFEKIRMRFEKINFQVAGSDILSFQEVGHRILAEYLALARNANVEEKTIEDIKNDMGSTLSLFLTPKGELRDLTGKFDDYKSSEMRGFFVSQLISPFQSFINSRVYDSLKEIIEKVEGDFTRKFIIWSCGKSGIMPQLKGITPPHAEVPK